MTDDVEPNWNDPFQQLVQNYERKVYQLILRQVEDPEIAEDLTQETFLTAYRSYARQSGEAVWTWLCEIALHRTDVYIRAQVTSDPPEDRPLE